MFPNDERAVRKRLHHLAKTVSLDRTDKLLSRVAKARKVPDFFTPQAVINVSAASPEFRNIIGRDHISELALAAQAQIQQIQVKFLDIVVEQVAPHQSSIANLTLVVDLNDDKNVVVQELKVTLQKEGKEWFISQIEPLKTLR